MDSLNHYLTTPTRRCYRSRMSGFVKIDQGILASTLWVDRDARDVFLTALLMAQPHELREPAPQLEVDSLAETGFVVPPGWYGFVPASGKGIIHRSLVPDENAGMRALRMLGSPDPESRTPDFDGRRLIRIQGGYLVLNYIRYRERDYTAADRSRRWRDRQKLKRDATRSPTRDTRDITQAEAEAYYESECVREASLPPEKLRDAKRVSEASDNERSTDVRESDDPPGSLDLKEALLGRGILVLSPAKLRAVLWRLSEVNWQPEDLDRLAETVGGKTAKQRHARMAALLCDEKRFNALNNEWCRQASEEGYRRA